jgi:formylglycine-generating enzyme required for sulfatase activity
LDLDQHELDRSLASLGEFQYVQLHGLLGTYDQGIPWICNKFTSSNIQKTVLWMGSSIGNQNRLESAMFLRRLQRMCMEPGDLFVIGFDKRNAPEKIGLAYDDSDGVTREFIMNGLDHVNHIMGQENFMDRAHFSYDSVYQEKQGRHLSHYRALVDTVVSYKTSQKEYNIKIQKDELIHVEHSYKYSLGEIQSILSAADLNMVDYWLDSKDQYRLVLAESRPFIFDRNLEQVRKTLFPSEELFKQEPINCYYCNEGQSTTYENIEVETLDHPLLNSNKTWPIETLPSLHEWQELWKSWDLVTQHMLNHSTMLYERPIALRHPFIFYLGHIPSFLDIQLSRHQVDKELGVTDLTEPQSYADIFERGIDPDMDNPSQCNPHSEVPIEDDAWPAVESILAYQKRVRERLQRLLVFWESEGFNSQSTAWINSNPDRKRQIRIVWMCFEHEAMHLETLLYMLIQSPNLLPPKGVALPSWKLLKSSLLSTVSPLSDAPTLKIAASSVTLGHGDHEASDLPNSNHKLDSSHEFGWDNENPQRLVNVAAFEIQTRPVTNGEYYVYLQQTQQSNAIPASWIVKDGETYVRTVFGPCPITYAQDWPVQTSFNEANGYAKFKGRRLPSETELVKFRDFTAPTNGKEGLNKWTNIGFENWSPTAVNNEQIHNLGDVWEWTETVWGSHEGFEASVIYPGYSADFFDGKHRVVLGGSWATHPRIAERKSFRNWYQSGYPYVFSGFRLCH